MVYIMFRVDKLLDQIFVSRFYGQLQAALPILRFFRLLIMDKIFIFSIFFLENWFYWYFSIHGDIVCRLIESEVSCCWSFTSFFILSGFRLMIKSGEESESSKFFNDFDVFSDFFFFPVFFIKASDFLEVEFPPKFSFSSVT